jgi:hypothetical protein
MRLMRKKHLILFLVVFATLLMFTQITFAQTGDCSVLAQTALTQVANNCAIPERNSTCYGFPSVEATFMDDAEPISFVKPGDRAGLEQLESLASSALNTSTNTWGIAVTNIQANLPVGMPGQGGVFVSLGDVRLENGVFPDEAVIMPETAVTISASDRADLYNNPPGFPVASAVVGSVPAGTSLQADAITEDGEWVRVYYEHPTTLAISAVAWIQTLSVVAGADFGALAVMTPDSFTPMQKFYLSNGEETPSCAEVPPSMLYVQGPEETELDFVVNDAHVRVSSTALIRVLAPGNTMQIIALSGLVVINPDSANPIILAPGFFSTTCLSDMLNLGIDGQENDRQVNGSCGWSVPEVLDVGLLQALYTALNNRIPQNIQYYASGVPRRVCASGIGGPICIIIPPFFEIRLRLLCRFQLLPQRVCQVLGYPWGRT